MRPLPRVDFLYLSESSSEKVFSVSVPPEGRGREGKEREGKGREGKGREGKEREGKGRTEKRKGRERNEKKQFVPMLSARLVVLRCWPGTSCWLQMEIVLWDKICVHH